MVLIPKNKAFLKKGYVKIFVICLVSLLVGFAMPTIMTFMPDVDYAAPGYEDYILLRARLTSISILFQNIGILLFCLAAFMGAIVDASLSMEVRRGLIMASGIGIIALIVLNRMILYFI